MVFYCQKNSYITEYKFKVVSSKKCCPEDPVGADCYEAIFEDTIFFPEGGGQPYDTGLADDVPVVKVLRRKSEAIHYLTSMLEPGSIVTQKIDWDRRFDHMQQHTGQHLITAVAEKNHGFATTSWSLGEHVCNIELDIVKITQERVAELETEVNKQIRSALPVEVQEYDSSDAMLIEAKTRGLPRDVSGPLRIVSIHGLDDNMCCGTHVKNLSELQSIKILYVEKGKANKSLLYFLAGNRVLSYFGECLKREKELNLLLHSNPSDHTRLLKKCQLDLKQQQKLLQSTLKDLAEKEANLFKIEQPGEKFYAHHRKDADAFYLKCLISSINDENVLKFLTAGGEKGTGMLIIDGPDAIIQNISNEVCQILDGKGGGKHTFTAKIFKMEKRPAAEKLVRDYVNKISGNNHV